MEKLRVSLEKYKNALDRLQEALQKDINEDDLYLDGIIQRFEFVYELSWKTIKRFLKIEGVECNTPRDCIKKGYQYNLIKDQSKWLQILQARNETSHTYSLNTALSIYNIILEDFYLFEELYKTLEAKLMELENESNQ